MEKPVDTAQIVLDNRGKKANQAASGGGGGGGSSVFALVLKSIAVLFVVCNVTALYVLHFVNHPSPTTRFTLSIFSATPGTKASEGDVVSLSSDNKLRNGAGTTAYLDRTTLADADTTYYEFLNVAKLGTSAKTYSTNLMSYHRVKVGVSATTMDSVLTSFTVDKVAKTVSISSSFDETKNVVASDQIRGIATLSDTQALVLVVGGSGTSVMPVAISSSGPVLDKSKVKSITTGSPTNYIAPLSSTTAIIAYFQPYVDATTSYLQSIKIATVGTDGTVTVSAATNFGPASIPNAGATKSLVNWGSPVVTSSTAGSFVIPYQTTKGDVGLCLAMSTYDATAKTVAAFPLPANTPCTTAYMPAYFIEGMMLADGVLMLAFHDQAKNYALTVVTVAVTATTAFFRGSFVVPEVAGGLNFGIDWGYDPELSLALLSGNRVAISFLNPSMNGRQSVKVLQYSLETLAFKDVTPVLPLAPSTFTLTMTDGVDADKGHSVTQKILAVGDDSFVAMHIGASGKTYYQQTSLVESFGAPMGVLRHYNGKSKADVAVSGKAKDVSTHKNMKMTVGKFYYATTAGYLITPASTTQSGAEYFTAAEDAKMLVTANGKVGVAIEKDELFVSI